jgi:hypothetical protein
MGLQKHADGGVDLYFAKALAFVDALQVSSNELTLFSN